MLLTTKEPITLIPVTNEANPGISAEDSESGDEVAPSPAVPNPFSNNELSVVQYKYERLHKAYHTALEANFHNAQGKVFVQELLVFLLPQEVYCCEISTSPHGDKQPGALTVEWVTHKPSPLQSRIEPILAFFIRFGNFVCKSAISHSIRGEFSQCSRKSICTRITGIPPSTGSVLL